MTKNPVGGQAYFRALKLSTPGPDGYLNSIMFRGIVRAPDVVLKQSGHHPNNAHIIQGVFQPNNSSDHIWEIEDGAGCRGNVLWGKLWDLHGVQNAHWAINSDGGLRDTERNAINVVDIPLDRFEVNGNSHNNYINNLNTWNHRTV